MFGGYMKSLRLTSLLFILFVGLTAFGTDWHVATTGTDNSSCGTAGSPCATIGYVDTNKVVAGDIVHVASGTYTGAIVTSTSGTSVAHITYISDVKWGAKIVSSTSQVWSNGGNYVDIKYFDISATGGTTAELLHLQANYDSAIGNRVHDMNDTSCISGAGIQMGGGMDHHTATGNIIFNIGEPPSVQCNQAHGVYVNTSYDTVQNNIIFNCGAMGVQIWGPGSTGDVVTNNTIFNNLRGIVVGSETSTPAAGNIISNNIVYNHPQQGIYETGTVGTNTFTNNLVYNNSPNWGYMGTDTHSSDVTANPLFVNFTGDATGDYHLCNTAVSGCSGTSPAIDAGTSAYAPTVDYDGNTRPQGSAYDIGAYEYTVTLPTGTSGSDIPGATSILRTASADPATCSQSTGSVYYNTSTNTLRVCSGNNVFTSLAFDVINATATLAFPSTTGGASSDLTITAAGAVLGDVVALGIPNASASTSGRYQAWVSAANTITVRYYATTTSQPASGVFKIMVLR